MAKGNMLTSTAVISTLVLMGGAAPAISASAQADLGGPDVTGYCEHLGFSGADLTPPPNRQWQCLRADGSTAAVDMQAACQFSFPQRPIVAKELTPDIPYTWQCLQGSPASEPRAGGVPTAAQLRAALLRALRPRGSAAKIGALRHSGAYPMRFSAPSAGKLRISWSYLPQAARGVKAKPIVLAAARASVARAGTVTVKVGLNAAGRRLFKHVGHVAITARGSFTAAPRATLAASVTFTLSR